MKILVIQTAFLGDCVLTLPLINTLKKNFKTDIYVLTQSKTKPIFDLCPNVDKIIIYDKKSRQKGLFPMIKIIKRLKNMDFDIAFLPQRSFRSGLIAYSAGITQRVGFNRGGARFFCNKRTEYDWDIHEIDRINSLCRAAGCVEIVNEFNLEPLKKEVQHYKEKLKPKIKKIGIAAQSEWPTKCWPIKKYRELVDRIKNKSQVILVGKNREKWEGENIVNLTGKTNISELVSIISLLDVLVSNDSGVIHIAAALNIPVIAIFGPTVPEMGFSPYGEMHSVIETDIQCRPCGLHGSRSCPERHFKCMTEIPVQRVADEINKKLIDGL
ncbi:MAG: lipopolysaccharide heptosyltransferase II [Elusimicrobiota bacterium]